VAQPIIRADGSIQGMGVAGIDRSTFVVGETVTFIDTEPLNNLATHSWVIVEKPTGAVAALTTPTAVSSTLLLDIEGTWIIQDTVGGLSSTRRVAVILPNLKTRVPAFGEKGEWNETGNVEGWSQTMEKLLRNVDDLHYKKTNILTVGNRSHDSATPLVVAQFEFDPTVYNGDATHLTMKMRAVAFNGAPALTSHVVLYNLTDSETVLNLSYTSDQATNNSGSLPLGNAASQIKLSSKIYEIRIFIDGPVLPVDVINLGNVEIELRTAVL
jgi:hypothetical protein